MSELLAYPAIFGFHDDGISIKFPDLPGCLSCADTPAEAMYMARDALAGRLWSDECDNIPFPAPTDTLTLKPALAPEQIVVLVDLDMQEVRDRFGGRVINKMVTMPEWLDRMGRREHVNFSQVIQDALMDKLGIKRPASRKRKH